MFARLSRAGCAAVALTLWGATHAAASLTVQNMPAAEGPGCRQVVIGLMTDAANVRPLVPRQFVFSRDAAGKAQLGYRIQTCDRLSVDGTPPRPVTWSELGVRILPPRGLPEMHVDPHVDGHDYFELAFRTSDRALARRLQAMGVRPVDAAGLLTRATWLRLERHAPPSADPTVADVLAGGGLDAGERTRRGAITLSADLVGGLIGRTTPVAHVHHWYADRRCRLVLGQETKSRTVGGLASFRVMADPGTLLASLMASGADGVDARGADTVVIADTLTRWERVAARPEPTAPVAHETVRHLSKGTPSGC